MRTLARAVLRGSISIAAVAAALVLPAAAQAASVSFTGDVLTYNAGAGESNNLTLTLATLEFSCGPRPAPCLEIQEIGGALTLLSDRCSDDGFGRAKCDAPASVVANLGDGEDAMFDWEGPSTIDGGPGNDPVLRGHGGADIINGGPGSDALFGGDGNDALNGGDGDDVLEGFGRISPEQPVQHSGSDVYVGGPGADFLDYAGKTENLSISIDGIANDGASGEADNVGVDVEIVRGGDSADTIVGSDAANRLDGWSGNDELRGGAGEDTLLGASGDDRAFGADGQDTIEGGDGSDLVNGGAGVDMLHGDQLPLCKPIGCATGRDTIDARDGGRDVVTCGPGEDSAQLDTADELPNPHSPDACEHIDRSTTGGGVNSGGDVSAPQLRNLRIGNVRRGRSTKLRYTLSEAAVVTFTVQRRTRRGGKVRWIKMRGTLRQQGKAGYNERRFNATLQGRRLKTGRYRLTAVARDAAGNRSQPNHVAFRVLR